MRKNLAAWLLIVCAFFSTVFLCFTNRSVMAKTYDCADITAKAAVLMEQSTGRVLLKKNSEKKLPMASCTKILTAITVIENCDVTERIEVDKRAVGIEGSSIYLRAGEKLTVTELLYGLMLQSGNDCAEALAYHVSGDKESFSNLLNDTARKIGAKNSNFVTPHGLHNDNHYTTAYDLALITCYALKNELFKKIVSTQKINISNDGYDFDRVIINKNKLLKNFEFADGVKTGYTKKAGRCFVGSATKDGMQLVAVVLDCGPMFEESQKLLQYGFNNYRFKTVYQKNKIFCLQREKKYVFYRFDEGFKYPVKSDGSENGLFNEKLHFNNDKTLKIEITFANKLIFSSQLSIINDSD